MENAVVQEEKSLDSEKERLWETFLSMFAVDLFGPEILEAYNRGEWNCGLEPVGEKETIIPVAAHEIALWKIGKSIGIYVGKRKRELPAWRSQFLVRAGKGLMDMFWAAAEKYPEAEGLDLFIRVGGPWGARVSGKECPHNGGKSQGSSGFLKALLNIPD